MTKKLSFKLKITVLTIVLFFVISALGLFAFRSYSGIIKKLQSNAIENVELTYTKATLDNIYLAGINVKSFTITKDSVYLIKYEKFRDEVYSQLQTIDSLEFDSDHQIIIDSIVKLSYLKVNQMDSLLRMHASLRVNNAINTAYEKIKDDIDDDEVSSKKQSKISQLFQKLKKKDDSLEEGISIDEIEESLIEVKNTESEINKELINRELELINYGSNLAEKISNQITELESLESEELAKTSQLVKKEIERLNYQVLIFCLILILFLILLIYSTTSYIRDNNRVKVILKKAKREAEKLGKAREQFLADVSHEIRTPMNAISGFTDQIAKGPLTTEQRDQIEMVQKSTTHLLHLVNDVLDLSKLKTGKLKLDEIHFDVYSLFEDIVAFARPLAEEKNTDLALKLKPNLPKILKGDSFRLQQVLINLVSNAIKFTENGQIDIEVFPTLLEGSQIDLKIVVKDTGVGIEEDRLKSVFNEFEQADPSTSRNYGGTGLGLTISKKIIDLYNGTIEIESELDKGTTIKLKVPMKIGEESLVSNRYTNVSEDTQVLQGKKVLIVDDEVFNRKLLFSMLKDKGAELFEASNGKNALQELKRTTYDLVLMDVRMPELGGIETTKRVRKINDNTKKNVPIVALTAAVTEQDKLNYFNSGMNGFVPKPFKEAALMKEIARVLAHDVDSKDSNAIVNGEMDKSNDVSSTVDFEELRKLSSGDRAFYVDMLQTFIQGADEAILGMNECFQTGNLRTIPDIAHKICAPARHLGAEKLYSILKKMELDGRKDDFKDYDNLHKRMIKEMEIVLNLVKEEIEKINEK